MYSFTLHSSSDAYIPIGSALALDSEALLLPTHYIESIERVMSEQPSHFNEESKIVLTNSVNEKLRVTITFKDFLKRPRVTIDGTEITIIKMFSTLSCRRITRRFISKSDLNSTFFKGKFDGCLLTLKKQVVMDRRASSTLVSQVCLNKQHEKYVTRAWKYAIKTEEGDCGSIWVSDPKITHTQGRSILGMHFAGLPSKGVGYSNILDQETIKTALDKLGIIRDCEPDNNLVVDEQSATINGSHMPYGRTKDGTFM
eukprot:UN22986